MGDLDYDENEPHLVPDRTRIDIEVNMASTNCNFCDKLVEVGYDIVRITAETAVLQFHPNCFHGLALNIVLYWTHHPEDAEKIKAKAVTH